MRIFAKVLGCAILGGLALSGSNAFAACKCDDDTAPAGQLNATNGEDCASSDYQTAITACKNKYNAKFVLVNRCRKTNDDAEKLLPVALGFTPSSQNFCALVDKAQGTDSSTSDSGGECMHAANFSGVTNENGQNLSGQNCQSAVNAVKNVQARDNSISTLGSGAMTAMGTVETMQAGNGQSDAMTAQSNMLKTMAVIKGVQAASSLAGAAQLGAADLAAQNASGAMAACNGDQACISKISGTLDTTAANSNVPGYLRQGSDEAKSAGQAAGSAALTDTVSAAVNGFIAYEALNAANNLQAASVNLGSIPLYGPGGGISSPSVGFTPGAPAANGGMQPSGATLPGTGSGGIKGELAGGGFPGAASSPYSPAVSKVSDAGGGGGMGGSGAPNPTAPPANKAKGLGATGIGELGVGGTRLGGGGSMGKDTPGANTSLEDAIKKLLGGEKDAKKDEEKRNLASTGEPIQADEGSFAVPNDVSIFQEITAKYRQLNNNGRI